MREPKAIGRPREFDTDDALSKILDVFWAKGFEGSSMSDLEAATGLRKGSLYAAFGDKRAMYLKALALYDKTAIDAGVEVLSGAGPAEQRISTFLQLAIDAVTILKDRRGCFLCNASVDQAILDPATEQLIETAVDRLLSNRTGVIIAHRLDTVNRADDILILDDGRVAEFGPRAELAADPASRFSQLLATGIEEVLR